MFSYEFVKIELIPALQANSWFNIHYPVYFTLERHLMLSILV